MFKDDILYSLNNYYNENPKLDFYKKCIDEIKKLSFKSDGLLTDLHLDSHLLESVRITILSNMNNYHLYLSNEKRDGCTNYFLDINETIRDKLLHQLVCITDYNDLLSLAKKQKLPNINFNFGVYIIISNKVEIPNNLYELKNLYEICGYVLGIESLNMLKYQRLDRIINFIKQGGESTKVYTILNEFGEMMKTHDWKFRDRFMVFSGATFQPIGLTYTRDVDLIGVQENKNSQEVLNIGKKFNEDVDSFILANDGKWYSPKENKVYEYRSIFYTYILPSFAGAENIFETMCDPKYNFSFMGIKFMCLEMNVKRYLARSSPASFADLIMLEKTNGYELGNTLCIPNMTVRLGKITVFDENTIDKIHKVVQKKLKEYYDYNMPLEEIKKILQKCSVNAFDIYRGKAIYDPDTSLVKKFHLDVKQQLFFRYCKDINYLLDIGSGSLTDARFWNRVGVKNVIGIEPSVASMQRGLERLERFGTKTDIKLINGVGDDDWSKDNKYSMIFQHKYDAITFSFTLHYMANNIETVMRNILKVVKKNTKIIITCMDGKLIHNDLKNSGKIEIRNSQEPIFAILPMYDYKQPEIPKQKNDVLVYLKGAYGVSSGSIEPIVDIDRLIRFFKNNGFRLVEMKKFLDYNSKNKLKMTYIQKKVSYYYTSIVFEYL